ncbi:sulfur oxidation protein (SoxA) [Luminiphilus syltensis NOR5-1B]|uniref:SoxAX cytochrome complex subunit A n=1 Tax=Luminiphilus syltensis NOR5-1B TaxID=565045 RepID=B8KX47_9GAMM|nr:sulfur oxidation c-type cytochrome SoxA [Luminiphilus syltensis]EED36746.1 sulfur oxidation protein (SoxA) [Luminiphilus syltensis NOR5-1B]
MTTRKVLIAALAVVVPIASAVADGGVFDEYREMMGDDNPAIFVIEEGEEFWLQELGPKQVSLETCDLGLGPGVVAGAYAQLPRYFADTDQVMDLESRLVHCMVELQGRDPEDVHAKPYSLRGDMGTEIEALAAWIADQSSGVPIAPGQDQPQERAMYDLGEQLFYYRAGPHDFSCATCHGQDGARIRLQALGNLAKHEDAASAYASWPAYRISEGVVRTMGWRMRDCFRQQRLPELIMGSEASVALQMYLAVNAAGAPMSAPGLKR